MCVSLGGVWLFVVLVVLSGGGVLGLGNVVDEVGVGLKVVEAERVFVLFVFLFCLCPLREALSRNLRPRQRRGPPTSLWFVSWL